MTYNKVIKLLNKDDKLLILLGGLLTDLILLVGLVAYATVLFAF